MGNYKVRVNSEAESREAQELFFQLGYEKGACSEGNYPADIIAVPRGFFTESPFSSRSVKLDHEQHEGFNKVTLPELRDLVVLKRNDVNDATHENGFFKYIKLTNGWYYFDSDETNKWVKSTGTKPEYYENLTRLKTTTHSMSINDQYAEIEQVRQDEINHPSHYKQGNIECIDALESATIGKSGIEAVCVANVIKYLWRYEEKNGLEDVKKAQWYLERLIASMDS